MPAVDILKAFDMMRVSPFRIFVLVASLPGAWSVMMYPFGANAGDASFTGVDEYVYNLTLRHPLVVFGEEQSEIGIGENCVVNFGDFKYTHWDNMAEPLPRFEPPPMLFPLWVDWDFTVGSNQQVYYREVHRGPLLYRATMEVRRGVQSNSAHHVRRFEARHLVVITWSNGTYWSGGPKTPANTIQLVLVSGALRQTYAFYIYGVLEWIRIGQYGRVGYDYGMVNETVEFAATQIGYYEYPGSGTEDLWSLAEYSNMHIDGQIMYQINHVCQPGLFCDREHGVCLEGGYCLCQDGYTGDLCETEINECTSSPCFNGDCQDEEDAFRCQCPPGFTGVRCEIDIDYCEADPCVHGDCHDDVVSYRCECDPGYKGMACETEINECDECPCSFGDCHHSILNFTCGCNEGYSGRGCDMDIDECADNECAHGECVDGLAHYVCFCHPGYTGEHCTVDIDECLSSPCDMGRCVDGVHGFSCDCFTGFAGETCDDELDECRSSPCLHGSCLDGINHYNCSCDDGYAGVLCESDIVDCRPSTCQPMGLCRDVVPGYVCDCFQGYSGVHCQTEMNECAVQPCANGNCIDGVNSYRCECEIGFTGVNCESNIDDCEMHPCLNGECLDRINSYLCSCHAGFTGTVCETNIDDCNTNDTCVHGYCRDGVDGFDCECVPGYEGEMCDVGVNECLHQSCVPGDCVDTVNGYICVCPDGVSGEHCEVDERPAVGSFGGWGPWTTCSKLCDNGLQTRHRPCLREPCLERNHERQLCNMARCQGLTHESDELTLLLQTFKSEKEVAEDEAALKSLFAEAMNTFCGENRAMCCRLINVNVPTVSSRLRTFQVHNVKIAGGYPVMVDNFRLRVKLAVNTTTESLMDACIGGVRKTVSNTMPTGVRIPSEILHKAFQGYTHEINEATCCWTLVADSTQSRLSYILMGTLIPLGVCLGLLLVIVLCCHYKICNPYGESTSPKSTDTLERQTRRPYWSRDRIRLQSRRQRNRLRHQRD